MPVNGQPDRHLGSDVEFPSRIGLRAGQSQSNCRLEFAPRARSQGSWQVTVRLVQVSQQTQALEALELVAGLGEKPAATQGLRDRHWHYWRDWRDWPAIRTSIRCYGPCSGARAPEYAGRRTRRKILRPTCQCCWHVGRVSLFVGAARQSQRNADSFPK